MKRVLPFFLIIALVFSVLPLSAFAEKITVEQRTAQLEEKYGINIKYDTKNDGSPVISTNALDIMDMALENVTANVVRQVSKYYHNKNGRKLTFSYVSKSPGANSEVKLAGFTPSTSLIELYVPTGSSAFTMMTGEVPINVVHEFAHALHLMYTDSYGHEKMRKEWTAYNGGIGYDSDYIAENPNDRVFVSGYAATMFEEDVAETIAHAFVRNQPGQGFKNKLSSGGNATGLGKKITYIDNMLAACLEKGGKAIENYRKIYSTATSVTYQGMKFSGAYLQLIGYPQPRYILNGTLKAIGVEKDTAFYLREIGGWYVKDPGGNEIIVFPGGAWCEVGNQFVAPTK